MSKRISNWLPPVVGVIALCAAALTTSAVEAQSEGATRVPGMPQTEQPRQRTPQAPLPFRRLDLLPDVEIENEKRRIVYFFLATCPHCRKSHDLIRRWGASLPPGFEFEVVPVVANPASADMARGYYAAKRTSRGDLPRYVQTAYEALQDLDMPERRDDTYRWIAQKAGLDPRAFGRQWTNRAVLDDLHRALRLSKRYQVLGVPALVIGGEYVITPTHTNGKTQLMLRVASGLISRQMEGQAP